MVRPVDTRLFPPYNPNIGDRSTARLMGPYPVGESGNGAEETAQLLAEGNQLDYRGDPKAAQRGVTIAKTLAAMYSATSTKITVESTNPPQISVTQESGIRAGDVISDLMRTNSEKIGSNLERTVNSHVDHRFQTGSNLTTQSKADAYTRMGQPNTRIQPGQRVQKYA